ncbi:hypothetical protein GGS20DRAFT_541457 [Poronia punctata]|nr:hypothetical protein GGS20DRAFT_541457 [Poronia punctata]
MALHYPLNGVDLDFERYVHQPVGAREIFINHMMSDLLEMRRIPPRTYVKDIARRSNNFGFVTDVDRQLSLDMQVMWRLVQLDWYKRRRQHMLIGKDLDSRVQRWDGYWQTVLGKEHPWEAPLAIRDQAPPKWIPLEKLVVNIIQAYYLERDFSVHRAIVPESWSESRRLWREPMRAHLSWFPKAALTHHRYSVFSGSCGLPSKNGPYNAQLSLGPYFFAAQWGGLKPRFAATVPTRPPVPLRKPVDELGYLALPNTFPLHRDQTQTWKRREKAQVRPKTTTLRRAPRRSQSLPNTDRWAVVYPSDRSHQPQFETEPWHYRFLIRVYRHTEIALKAKGDLKYVLLIPVKPLSELYKRSRRRSLSRSHIRAMFTDKPRWEITDDEWRDEGGPEPHPCANCAQRSHQTKDCRSNCGYCFSSKHMAPRCPMEPQNRCKCRPFPQFHRSTDCGVRCSRRCGCPYAPGHYKHFNAMRCSYRCCMCGIKGHSGRKCQLKHCPCGRHHLTQDCRWKVECAAPGCSLYLCSIHCRECGKKREKGAENAFVARTCRDCLGNGKPVAPAACDVGTQ